MKAQFRGIAVFMCFHVLSSPSTCAFITLRACFSHPPLRFLARFAASVRVQARARDGAQRRPGPSAARLRRRRDGVHEIHLSRQPRPARRESAPFRRPIPGLRAPRTFTEQCQVNFCVSRTTSRAPVRQALGPAVRAAMRCAAMKIGSDASWVADANTATARCAHATGRCGRQMRGPGQLR